MFGGAYFRGTYIRKDIWVSFQGGLYSGVYIRDFTVCY